MTRWRVTKQDSADLGFANAAFMDGVITIDEFRAWAERVVANTPNDDLPAHMIDVMLMPDTGLTKIWRDVLGFYPYDPILGAPCVDALTALAYCRGIKRRFHPDWMTQAQAVEVLNRHPQVLDRFKDLFPDISISIPEVAA